MKDIFQSYVDSGNIGNITLAGNAGIGKTTIAKAMCNELDSDILFINGSLDRNIDTLRNEVGTFASSISLLGGRKYVLFDEADYLNKESTQPALRNFIEAFSNNCGFILTCNFPSKIIEPIFSRAPLVDMNIKRNELPEMAGQFLKRACEILDAEGIEYEKKVVAEVIKKHMPDWRSVLGDLQRYASTGKIDAAILAGVNDKLFDDLIENMRAKNFTKVREWVALNSEIDPTALFRKFYDTCSKKFELAAIPPLVLLIAKYQYQAANAVDQEINMAAFFVEVMVECPLK